MNKKQLAKSRILASVSFYRYFFSFFMAVCLFVLPIGMPHPSFIESKFLDVLVRCVLWLFFVFSYRSLSVATTNQLLGTKN